MERRALLKSALAGFLGSQMPRLVSEAWADEQEATPFSFQTVIARAREAAAAPFERPKLELVEPFADLKYDQFRGIRFRDDKRFFLEGGGFQMDLLPPGFSFQDKIEVNLVFDGNAHPIPFSTDYFQFHPDYFPYPEGRAPEGTASDMGFSGIRFRYPINRPGVWDEMLVFQGASYFRSVAFNTYYGLSARGLAINTAQPDPEEFPLFTAFWVEEPKPGDRVLRLFALLDSQSVAGAYAFSIEPGGETVMDIQSVLFPRVDIDKVGVAPLTSMYFFGPDDRARVDDFRDAVHDSSGLRIVNGSGERLWRPLRNPPKVESSSFSDNGPKSFGLIQRNRDFEHFEDSEAHYERRTSAWVEPKDDWGPGYVMLFELPSSDEFADNIVAFWRPKEPLPAGSEQHFSYRLVWGVAPLEDVPLAKVIGTRSGLSILDKGERVYVIDFDLGMINIESVTPVLRSSGGETKGLSISPMPGGNLARVGFHFVTGDLTTAEFRLVLESHDLPASETWLYRWTGE